MYRLYGHVGICRESADFLIPVCVNDHIFFTYELSDW